VDFDSVLRNGLQAAVGVDAIVFALAAIGLNVHFGYAGLLNFGQAAFVLVGAYGIGIGVVYLGLPLGVALLLGLAGSIVLALLLGIPTLRLRADYLAIVTIAAAEILRLVARANSFRDVSGGSDGLSGFAGSYFALNPFPPGDYGFGYLTFDERGFYNIVVGWSLVAISVLAVFLWMRSPWGRVLKAIREDEDAVRSLGKNVFSYKMQALIIGGVIGCLAGFVYSLSRSSVQPDNYGTAFTFFAYTVLLLGGAARVFGPVLGAMIFWLVISLTDTLLRQGVNNDIIPSYILNGTQVGQVRFMLVGLALMLLMIYRPQGIFGDRRELMLDAR